MTLFEIILLIIILEVLLHLTVMLVGYKFEIGCLYTPYEIWHYGHLSIFGTLFVYISYTIIAPVFGIIGLVVWAICKEY